MERRTWVGFFGLVGLLTLFGCGEPPQVAAVDIGTGGQELPDGFLQEECISPRDCDDLDACTDDACGPDRKCRYSPKMCMLAAGKEPACNEPACNKQTGACETVPVNESGPCTLPSLQPGQCLTGTCSTTPQCAIQSVTLGCISNKTVSGNLSGASVLDHYTCAAGAIGPEKAYRLTVPQERLLTVKLTAADDLDLIVLDSTSCVSNVACEGSATTSGSGNEEVTFTAKANRVYLLVVESRALASTSFKLDVECVNCAPIRTLACNDSVVGNTAGSASAFGGWACDPMTPGPEDIYRIAPAVRTDYRLKLTGLSQDLDLLVVPESGGQCNPATACTKFSVNAGTADERVDFTGLNPTVYDVVVDSKTAGSSYQLTLECPPSCAGKSRSFTCGLVESARNDDASFSTNVVNNWQCDAGTTGPEYIYRFEPTQLTSYTFDLTGLTADLDLIVMEGLNLTTCDATNPCVAVSAQPGTIKESVTFMGDPAKDYFIAVDGKNGAVSPFTLKLRSSACAAASCYKSGNDLTCAAPGDARRNDDSARSRNIVDDWACAPNSTGPEVVYRFQAINDGSYTFTLDGLTDDLDLIVVEGTSGTCSSGAACVASSTQVGTASESVTFAGVASKYYFIAVDGKDGAVSPYTLKMTSTHCPAASCYNSLNILSCDWREESRRNDDPTRSKNQIEKWDCAAETTGPEVVYQFKPTVAGSYTVDLEGLGADLDLMVLSSTSSTTCDSGAQCVGGSATSGPERVTFAAVTSRWYYIAVDGKQKAVGDYHVRLSGACAAPVCKNGNRPLSCTTSTLSGRNDATGATSSVNTWGACSTGGGGPEFAHYFKPTTAGTYTFQLIGQKADLDLIVLLAPSTTSCDPTGACVASSVNGSKADESVTFSASTTQGYWIIVDGHNGAVSPYTLAIVDGCP